MTDYTNADRCCDLVMKGGITSGILYPPAICRIAEQFHLVGIGGTSAGAIAACAAAAAEYRRRCTGGGEGYELLEALPGDFSDGGSLAGLFRPDGPTRKLFGLVRQGLAKEWSGCPSLAWWATKSLWSLIRIKKRLRRVVDNGYGLCSGMANDNPPGAGEIAPLTVWLAAKIDEIAGKDDGTPLTFGDLRHAPMPAAQNELACADEHSIDLRAVTTCVSFGRPLELPFDGLHIFGFDEDEWRSLFPAHVVDYMVKQAEGRESRVFDGTGKLPLPVGDAMPVVVAARMSLSFPGLFTMVPLYAADHENGSEIKKVWFSDGGITSNLPIHRFDSLLPRWPTLAINLQYMGKDGEPGRSTVHKDELIYMIPDRSRGTLDLWNPFDQATSPVAAMFGFVGAIFRSAQVWHDNSFLKLPGYRDRVVEIWLANDEGGLNFDMPPKVIERLLERGGRAGVQLRDRFAVKPPDDQLSWDGHRWVRFRSAMAGLMEYLLEFKCSAERSSKHERSLEALFQSISSPPTSKFFKEDQLQAAKEVTADLEALADKIAAMPCFLPPSKQKGEPCTRPFCGGPRPPVEIASRARM